MRTENEIRAKIDYYMERLEDINRRSFVIGCGSEAVEIYGIIDALLWVIGDESGKKI